MPVFDVLYDYRDKLKHILVRHEQGATHAAQGYARVSGKTGVVMVTSGPAATNIITGLSDAMMDSTPLIVITTGNVDIELNEWADEARTQPFQDKTGVMPGTKVTKIVEVKKHRYGRGVPPPVRGEECLRRGSEADEIRSRQPGLRQ